MNCRICQRTELSPKAPPTFDLCTTCANTLGVVPMPPPRRPARPCNRCNGMRFIRVVPRELTATGGDYVSAQAAPMTLTIVPMVEDPIFASGKNLQIPDPWNGRGLLETYVCRSCGFVEWYCSNPESIPLGPEYMADDVNYETASPYR